jgi:hypothetical protein
MAKPPVLNRLGLAIINLKLDQGRESYQSYWERPLAIAGKQIAILGKANSDIGKGY